MKELIEAIAKALVEFPDEVSVKETETGDELLLELSVAATDKGRIIGKQGRIVKAVRVVLKAASLRADKKVRLEVLE